MPGRPDPDAFYDAFADLQLLILQEWPEVSAEELAATAGEIDAVVALVARVSGQTRVLTRRQLGELLAVLAAPEETRVVQRAPARRSRDTPPPPRDPDGESLDSLLSSLEGHLDDLTREVKRDMAPLAAETAREHLGLVLLVTGGVGLMVGLFLGAMGYPHGASDPGTEATDAEE